MEILKIIRIEEDWVIVIDQNGTESKLAVEDLVSNGFQTKPKPSTSVLSPKEIQSRVRSGDTIENLVRASGADPSYIEKYAAPILDERNYILDSALSSPVMQADEESFFGEQLNFGAALEQRILSSYQTEPIWNSWKDLVSGAWIIQLIVYVDNQDYDARWQYDAKKQSLTPINDFAERITGSENDEELQLTGSVDTSNISNFSQYTNESRFDSAAFTPANNLADTKPHAMENELAKSNYSDTDAVVTQLHNRNTFLHPAESKAVDNETDVLLESLKKKRGERESLFSNPESFTDDFSEENLGSEDNLANVQDFSKLSSSRQRSKTGGFIDLSINDSVEIKAKTGSADTAKPEATETTESENASEQQATTPKPRTSSAKKGRQAVPSWDEIIFGTKPDEN